MTAPMPVSRKNKRPIRKGRAFLLLGLGAAGAAAAWKAREAAQRCRARSAPALAPGPVPDAGERVLVIAPHPDDETLALGGLIHQAVRRGADVRIAFLTSGDGFALCGALRARAWPNAAAMRDLARLREAEARSAAAALGVDADRLRFLGYPDRGLSALWQDFWHPEAPYRSPHTNRSATPDGLPYCGRSLLQDLEALVRGFSPDRLYYPDSLDDHPDHWAAFCFTRMALARIPPPRPVERTYLVHRGSWPQPLGEDRSLYLAPPAEALAFRATWESFPLDGEALRAKGRALAAHQSQEPLVGNFLRAFLRQNELTADWGSPETLVEDGRLLADATRDRLARLLCGGLDFTALEVRRNGNALDLRAHLRSAPVPGVTYRLCWKPLRADPERAGTRSRLFSAGEELVWQIPVDEAPEGELMIAGFAEGGGVLWDRTPWFTVAAGINQ